MKEETEEIVSIKLPSQHQIDDIVLVQMNKQKISGRVISVKFTDINKVYYDISVQVSRDDETELHEVDSYYVTKI